ncbi:polyvinyl alcohol dehydrogenase [Thermobispora bispora]|uniref:STAS domain-containing protein n=1 Tax=Thermobispora bispora TaxID=2006 RepID=UPI00197D83F8|nr:STAS domain-containing protein [Thermobispora bispora]MBO2475686.1 anti-anti-sigma factor [Actinomycetales bacterium]MDI9581114.1 STAS domain-containing protein [Thermobispora sp.]QSI47162.1 STAS domain-containing protein [Thermobispora bispora]
MTVQAEAAIRRTKDLFLEQDGRLLDQWSEKANISADELRELYRALRAALAGEDEDFTDVRGLLAEFSRTRVRQGYTPSETARTVFALKDAMYEIVEADGSPEALRGFAWFSRLVDDLGLFTFETFSNAREKVILDQTEQLLELSTPVVKLWEGIVAVPLVGTLDSARTQVVMEKLLQTLMETGSQHAVIDITGVPAVDTQVAHHLLKTVMAARLMGAECVISGIRPQIAHTIVTLGIEFGDIVTKASLADALAHALRRSGAEIKVNGRWPDEEETESSP